jgi:REP element-mobilizing transposase RayT
MNTLMYQYKYRRRLPHIQPPGATFFITFRLVDSIPQAVWGELRERLRQIHQELTDTVEDDQTLALERERRWFQEFDDYLHNTTQGPFWLQEEQLAALVAKALHHFDGARYRLDAFCVMSNHVHVVLMPLPTTEAGKEACLHHKLVEDQDGTPGYVTEDATGQQQFVAVTFHGLASIMHSIKRHTAREANLRLGRSGAFWQTESYDRYSRDHEEWWRTIRYVLNNPVKAGLVQDWQDWPWSWCRENLF